ncbi:hypothetical protein [Microbacterium sp.]|uniref:hypothetical protein n=1 Tax=Microbacterium sp. TaxID=51671 RepID=UPI003A8EC078
MFMDAVVQRPSTRLDNNGQSCSGAKRFRDRRAVRRVRHQVRRGVGGVGEDRRWRTPCSVRSRQAAAHDCSSRIGLASQQGATCSRGRRRGFFAPTVLADVTPRWTCAAKSCSVRPRCLAWPTGRRRRARQRHVLRTRSYVFTTDAEQAERVANGIGPA